MDTQQKTGRQATPFRVGSIFENGQFALFVLITLVLWHGLMLVLAFMPAPEGAFGEFARDFRKWCFNPDPETGSVDWTYVLPLITAPLILGAMTLAVYYPQLKSAVRRPLALFACALAALVAVGSAGAGWFWMSEAVPPIAQVQQPGTPLPFPADKLRVALTPPSFSLPNQNGHAVSLEQYRGKVVILTGVYSTCAFT